MAPQPRTLHFDIPDGPDTTTRHRIACYEWGDPQAAEVVLCVHGLTRNGRDFDYLARDLAQDYRVLCPDMPGRGLSSWLKNPQGYNQPAYIADVLWILRALSLPRVHWIGTSMGGIMGMMVASQHPGLIKTLILNDIGCFIPKEGLARIYELADLKTKYPNRQAAEDAYVQRCAGFGISDEAHWQHMFTYGLRERPGGTTEFTYDPAIFSVGIPPKGTPVTDLDLWPLWQYVASMPVLLIRGEESDLLASYTANEMRARHPDLYLHEVAGAGHAPSLMENKEIALIHEWISAKLETP